MKKICLKCDYLEDSLQISTCKKCGADLQIELTQLNIDLKNLVKNAKDHATKIIDTKLIDYQPFVLLLITNNAMPQFHLQLACSSLLSSILKIGDLLSYEDQLILVKNLCVSYTEVIGTDSLTENLNYFQNNQKELNSDQEIIQLLGAWPVLSSLNLSKDLKGFKDLLQMGEATQNMILDFGIFISEFSEQLSLLINKKSIN